MISSFGNVFREGISSSSSFKIGILIVNQVLFLYSSIYHRMMGYSNRGIGQTKIFLFLF